MTDGKYVLKETNKERSKMAQGSRHKINGCKTKKCTLPHENLTKGELLKMNSPVKTYKMDSLEYKWEDFLEMPDDIKIEYINTISKKYQVSLASISQNLFRFYSKFYWIFTT